MPYLDETIGVLQEFNDREKIEDLTEAELDDIVEYIEEYITNGD